MKMLLFVIITYAIGAVDVVATKEPMTLEQCMKKANDRAAVAPMVYSRMGVRRGMPVMDVHAGCADKENVAKIVGRAEKHNRTILEKLNKPKGQAI